MTNASVVSTREVFACHKTCGDNTPRICTVAEIRLRDSGRCIRVFNTHFDHISGPARNLAARIILQYMQELDLREPMPKLLMGDLNASYDSRCVRILRENLHQYPFRLQEGDIRFDCL